MWCLRHGVERTHWIESPIAGKDLTMPQKLRLTLHHDIYIEYIPDELYVAGFAPAKIPAYRGELVGEGNKNLRTHLRWSTPPEERTANI